MSEELKLFQTQVDQCSYIDGLSSQNIICDPNLKPNQHTQSFLVEHGFRRSGDYLYRPNCPACKACTATKVLAAEFKPNRKQKRCWVKNQDLEVSVIKASYKEEHFDLFTRYLDGRHADGGMAGTDKQGYQSFLWCDWSDTLLYEFRLNGQLLGVAVTDQLATGLSAVYTFFDPDAQQRSLGTFAVLWQIKEAQRLNLDWVYLGYWIEASSKMNYKTEFKPIQLFRDGQWQKHSAS